MAIIRPTGYLSHYGFSPEETEEHLAHYGVKGMKWGKKLKAKITDLSDQYITGKSARQKMESQEKLRDSYQQKADDWKSSADKSSKKSLDYNEDVSKMKSAVRQPNRSAGYVTLNGQNVTVKYRNLGAQGRAELIGIGNKSAALAKTSQQSSNYARTNQRANESNARTAAAKAASARKQYEKSLSGKLSKLASSIAPSSKMTVTDLKTGETTTIKKKKK